MDSYEATRVVYSRIQKLDPDNASKIMGLLLIQDHGEKVMIRLACGPESLVHSIIFKARKELGISSNTSPSTTPSSISRQNSKSIFNLPSPLSIPNNSSAQPFYCGGGGGGEADTMDDFHFQEQLSFLNDGLPHFKPESPDFSYPGNQDFASFGDWNGGPHRRSCSVNDVFLAGSDDSAGGFGWKPCLYYAKGYCKNGTSCRFGHGHGGSLVDSDVAAMELLRSNSAHQHRLAAASQLMGSAKYPYSPNKSMNFLLQQQQNDSPRAVAAALMMGEEINQFGRNLNEFSEGVGMVNPAARQIYLTFPADSTFREEDVSNYFSIYGPVQDVRIPYQQKRMFGFVTFVYPDTVKLILAKGNPHFVCDARVLVKPYKEKGKVPEKFRKQQQQMETGEYSSCGSPTSFDSREPFDSQLEARMLYKSQQDMLWRRKLEEQADLQHAIDLQNRRLMSLQLLDVKRNHHHRALSTGAAIPSPTHSPSFPSHSSFFHSNSDRSSPEEDDFLSRLETPVIVNADHHQTVNGFVKEREKEKESSDFLGEEEAKGNLNGKSSPYPEGSDFQKSLEHNLPESLFASPKSSGDYRTIFSTDTDKADKNRNGSVIIPASLGTNNLITAPLLPATSTLDMASLKSCYFQVPSFASGHGAIGM